MTLRKLKQNVEDSFNGAFDWFSDGWSTLASGDIMGLTIGQAVLFIFIIGAFLNNIVDGLNNIVDDFKSSKDNDD